MLQALPERVFGIMRNDTLLAIPFFTFMGLILERSGMAEDLLDTIGQMFGPVRGGLAYAVVFVGALLAATTGVVAASVISMGLISLPIMLRYGYDRRLAAGVIAASGTLAQIIPPSLVLIVMADQLGRSVGDMYQGAFIPGLSLAGALRRLCLRHDDRQAGCGAGAAARGADHPRGQRQGRLSVSRSRSSCSPSPPAYLLTGCMHPIWACGPSPGSPPISSRSADRLLKHRPAEPPGASRSVIVMIPPLALIFLVLGTIFLGIATPTEGGAMGATGALILALAKRRLELVAAAPGDGLDRQAVVLRHLHPGRLDGVQPGVPRRQRRSLGRAPADQPARRPARLPDRRQRRWSSCWRSSSISSSSPSSSCRCCARWRNKLGIDLIWFGVLLGGQHADLVPAPAVRLRAVLPAQRRADREHDRPGDRQADRAR